MLGCKRVGEQEGRSTNGVTVWRRGCFQMEKTGMYLRDEGREPTEGEKITGVWSSRRWAGWIWEEVCYLFF